MRIRRGVEQMFDQMGPGTAAWEAFDRALAAARAGRMKSHPEKKNSFPQRKAEMRYQLRRIGANEIIVAMWTAELESRVAMGDYEGIPEDLT